MRRRRRGGVEVSVDGGATWKPATGRDNWTFTWTAEHRGPRDDHEPRLSTTAATSQTPGPSVTVTVRRPATCPCTHLEPVRRCPAGGPIADLSAVEVGIKFRADATATSRRPFLQGLGEHRHARRATCGRRPARDWRRSRSRAKRRRAGSRRVPDAGRDHREHDLHRLLSRAGRATTPSTTATSRRRCGQPAAARACRTARTARTASTPTAPSTLPDEHLNSENYWVDVVFAVPPRPDTTPPTVSSTTPANCDRTSLPTTNITATFSEAMDAATIAANTFELRRRVERSRAGERSPTMRRRGRRRSTRRPR